MNQAKLGAKNQIIIPEMVREKLQLAPGDVLDFRQNEQGEIVLRKGNRVDKVFALLDHIHQEAKVAGITEDDLLEELAKVREENRHDKA